jgi:hypothetical protein
MPLGKEPTMALFVKGEQTPAWVTGRISEPPRESVVAMLATLMLVALFVGLAWLALPA